MTIICKDGTRLSNPAWEKPTWYNRMYAAYIGRCRKGNAVPLGFSEWVKIKGESMALNDWDKLKGCKIKEIRHEGDLEWAKQNGLENCIYLITNKGTVTLDIGIIDNPEDLANGEPYITIDFSW